METTGTEEAREEAVRQAQEKTSCAICLFEYNEKNGPAESQEALHTPVWTAFSVFTTS